MKSNLGTVDKIMRLVIAAAIAVLCLTGIATGTFAIVLIVLAGILVLTSLISFCPLYYLFGIKTCKKEAY